MNQHKRSFRKSRFTKALVYFFVGILSYPGIAIFNRLKISGTEYIKGLPKQNVLFVSNHQTYFADVITFLHIFCAVKWGKKNRLGLPFYLLNPFTRVYYVAAAQTMKSSLVSKLFTLAGAIMVKRTWAKNSNETRKGLDVYDTRNINEALAHNWLITFPQGTTTPFAPGRKGTAFTIKQQKPIVIPVVIDGFSKAFNKKGLKMIKMGTVLTVRFKEPLKINFDDSMDDILEQVMDSIEQSTRFNDPGETVKPIT